MYFPKEIIITFLLQISKTIGDISKTVLSHFLKISTNLLSKTPLYGLGKFRIYLEALRNDRAI